MTTFIYVLEIPSTGEEIFRETVEDIPLKRWHKRTEAKVMRYQRTPLAVRTAITSGDTLAGLANFDALKLTGNDMPALNEQIFKGYDKFYEQRLEKINV